MKAITVRKPSIALIILVVLVALLAIPSTTVRAAHAVTVTLDPVASNDTPSAVAFTLAVKNDSGSADDIVEVKLDVPPAGSESSNFVVTLINNPTGWTSSFATDEFTKVNVITWTTSTNQIGANSTEIVEVEHFPDAFVQDLLASLTNFEVPNLPFRLEGRVHTEEDGFLQFKHKGHLYPVPGKPGQFRSATIQSSRIRQDDPFREIDDDQ